MGRREMTTWEWNPIDTVGDKRKGLAIPSFPIGSHEPVIV